MAPVPVAVPPGPGPFRTWDLKLPPSGYATPVDALYYVYPEWVNPVLYRTFWVTSDPKVLARAGVSLMFDERRAEPLRLVPRPYAEMQAAGGVPSAVSPDRIERAAREDRSEGRRAPRRRPARRPGAVLPRLARERGRQRIRILPRTRGVPRGERPARRAPCRAVLRVADRSADRRARRNATLPSARSLVELSRPPAKALTPWGAWAAGRFTPRTFPSVRWSIPVYCQCARGER